MWRSAQVSLVVAVAGLLAAAAPAVSPVGVPEPAGLYEGPQHGYTPATLKGATVIDRPALERLVGEKAVLVDVALADRRPAGLPATVLWLPTHRSIPGAVWMPNAGAAPLSAEQEKVFFERVAELTGGDKTRPVVTFCKPECWGSWNAGKRLVAAGYRNVYWFPPGLDDWQETHDTVVVKPDEAWATVMVLTLGEAQR